MPESSLIRAIHHVTEQPEDTETLFAITAEVGRRLAEPNTRDLAKLRHELAVAIRAIRRMEPVDCQNVGGAIQDRNIGSTDPVINIFAVLLEVITSFQERMELLAENESSS